VVPNTKYGNDKKKKKANLPQEANTKGALQALEAVRGIRRAHEAMDGRLRQLLEQLAQEERPEEACGEVSEVARRSFHCWE
jgi:hypothetical protein